MKRLAFFVEGYTEVVFVRKLIEEIAGDKVRIEHRKEWGGRTIPRRTVTITLTKDTGQEYYVLIVDCGSDEQVKTRIQDEHKSFTDQGYSKIIGMRDIRGKFTHADIPRLEAYLPKYIKTSLIPVQFVLAIMETEAWFLAETSHYPKIDPTITLEAIKTTLGFDPENDDMEQRPTPSDDLNDCYGLGGKAYEKRNAQTTIDALDYARIYFELHKKFRYLEQLIGNIETFLT